MIFVRSAGLVALAALFIGGQSSTFQPTSPECDRPIANVAHDDVHFSVSIDKSDNRFLDVVVPEKVGATPGPPRLVRLRIHFRDESTIEGSPLKQPSAGSGGYVDWHYRFDAKRQMTSGSIFSVTIWVGDQMFEVFPW